MHIRLALALAAIVLVFAGPVRAGELPAATHEFQFHVTGMTCGLCAKAVEKGLRGVEGVRDVQIDREAERVRVIASSDLSTTALEAAIEGAGSYEADLVGPKAKEPEAR